MARKYWIQAFNMNVRHSLFISFRIHIISVSFSKETYIFKSINTHQLTPLLSKLSNIATSHISIIVLLFLSLTPLSFSERCHPSDKKALLQIKKDLNNPNLLISWKPKTDCCRKWFGIKCNKKTNRTINLEIYTSDLKLPIPAAIGDLPFLQFLQFNDLNLTGQIPVAISKLSNLIFLDLSSNHLTGPIPSFLGQLKKLFTVALTSNRLTGSIPASLSQLPELAELQLDHNKLTGSIPESFGDFKNHDIFLFINDNHLSGPIPRNLGSASFFWLDVSRNRLEGDISFMFGKNKSLNTANFSGNLFEFNLSRLVIPKALIILDLNHNKIYGSIPEELTKSDLSSLNVSYNRLCGQIPVGGRLQELDYTSYFHNKCLCGSPLPKCK